MPRASGDALEPSHTVALFEPLTLLSTLSKVGERIGWVVAARGRLISPGVSQLAYGSLAFRSRIVGRYTSRWIDDSTPHPERTGCAGTRVAWFAVENSSYRKERAARRLAPQVVVEQITRPENYRRQLTPR
jgi:hypothetical protein